jgi:hypothetical protein
MVKLIFVRRAAQSAAGLLFPALLLLYSCEGLPPERQAGGPPAVTPGRFEKPEIPRAPEAIMGTGRVSGEQLAEFLETFNPGADKFFVRQLADIYVEEARREGVNHDAAFAQMCLETGYLRFGNLVTPEMNNFCGLGAIGPGQRGEYFPDPRTGVRAHIQHLKGYATKEPLNGELADPRYRWISYGSAPTIQGLAGTWAADKEYAHKIKAILEKMYLFAFG